MSRKDKKEDKKPDPQTAKRALQEAAERHELRAQDAAASPPEKEFSGRDGLDPARYGDWENKGIASDF